MGWRDAWEQVTHGGKHHAGLAEFRKNAGDVVQEGGVRADDEHASGSQLFAMGVEQIRHSMERHCGLSCAGSALNYEDAAGIVADDLILFALDGLHDGFHVARTCSLECLVERGFTGNACAFRRRACT